MEPTTIFQQTAENQLLCCEIKPVSGDPLRVDLQPQASVRDLQNAIQKEFGHLAGTVQLFAGVGENEKPLSEYETVAKVETEEENNRKFFLMVVKTKCACCKNPHQSQVCECSAVCCKKCAFACVECAQINCKDCDLYQCGDCKKSACEDCKMGSALFPSNDGEVAGFAHDGGQCKPCFLKGQGNYGMHAAEVVLVGEKLLSKHKRGSDVQWLVLKAGRSTDGKIFVNCVQDPRFQAQWMSKTMFVRKQSERV